MASNIEQKLLLLLFYVYVEAWLEDPEAWRVLSRKSILVLLFNSNVLPPLVYLLLDHFEALEPHSMA